MREPVAMGRVEQQDVAVPAQTAMRVEQPRLCAGEERFASSDRGGITCRDARERFEVQRIADVLEP